MFEIQSPQNTTNLDKNVLLENKEPSYFYPYPDKYTKYFWFF